jgi:hypothetical protein
MVTSRRTFALAAAGAGAAVIAPTAIVAIAARNAGLIDADTRPFEPWAALAAARPGDLVSLVAAAILAANPHNTQPWIFEIAEGAIILRADARRHLGSFDPFRREMWIGLGCAVEAMAFAGPALGFDVEAHLAPDPGAPMPAIRLACRPRPPASDAALAVIAARRTNRAPYGPGAVDPTVLARLGALAGEGPARATLFAADSPTGARFAAATIAATARINADAQMSADSHRWLRANAAEVARHRDGVSVPTSGLSPLVSFFGQILPPPDLAAEGRYWLASTRAQVATAAQFGAIAVDDLYDRAHQLAAGRLWQRLHLAITDAGLAAQPLNQLPELVDRARQRGADGAREAASVDAFADRGGHVAFCFRFGRPGAPAPHAARRSLGDVLAGSGGR